MRSPTGTAKAMSSPVHFALDFPASPEPMQMFFHTASGNAWVWTGECWSVCTGARKRERHDHECAYCGGVYDTIAHDNRCPGCGAPRTREIVHGPVIRADVLFGYRKVAFAAGMYDTLLGNAR